MRVEPFLIAAFVVLAGSASADTTVPIDDIGAQVGNIATHVDNVTWSEPELVDVPGISRLSSAPPARAGHLYAESGLWYDAFDQLSSWLATERGAALLRSHRAALLEQVGLGDAAAFDRRSAPNDR